MVRRAVLSLRQRHRMALSWFLECFFFYIFVETPIRFCPTIEQMLLGDLRFSVHILLVYLLLVPRLSDAQLRKERVIKIHGIWTIPAFMMDRILCGLGMLLCVVRHHKRARREEKERESGSNKAFHVNGDRAASGWRDHSRYHSMRFHFYWRHTTSKPAIYRWWSATESYFLQVPNVICGKRQAKWQPICMHVVFRAPFIESCHRKTLFIMSTNHLCCRWHRWRQRAQLYANAVATWSRQTHILPVWGRFVISFLIDFVCAILFDLLCFVWRIHRNIFPFQTQNNNSQTWSNKCHAVENVWNTLTKNIFFSRDPHFISIIFIWLPFH